MNSTTVTCPYCGACVAVTAALTIDVHYHYDGIPCGGSATSARRAMRKVVTSRVALGWRGVTL